MNFDHAILGGGAAGLSLALALTSSRLEKQSILIVEKDAKNTNDRTWCFWDDGSAHFRHLVQHRWPKVSLAHAGRQIVQKSRVSSSST